MLVGKLVSALGNNDFFPSMENFWGISQNFVDRDELENSFEIQSVHSDSPLVRSIHNGSERRKNNMDGTNQQAYAVPGKCKGKGRYDFNRRIYLIKILLGVFLFLFYQ